jgi:translation initiation factor IF-3
VRLIGADGAQLGIMAIKEALDIAEQNQLDLVEVAPEAQPPVCRIMDYGKYRYEQSRKAREYKRKQASQHIKEVRMTPNISEHDYQFKSRNVARFLQAGDKVKVTVRFRGREITHKDLGVELLERMAVDLGEVATVERKPKLESNYMSIILAPK